MGTLILMFKFLIWITSCILALGIEENFSAKPIGFFIVLLVKKNDSF